MEEKQENGAKQLGTESGKENKLGKEPLTIDEAVDSIYNGFNLKLLLVFLTATGTATQTPMQIYITIFAGFIPYTQWECSSNTCTALLNRTSDTKEFYSRKTMCDNSLEAGTDFEWTSERTSFSTDWGLYCDDEAKFTTISSFFFIGATLGLLVCTAVFDRFGRRNGAIAGNLIGATATLLGTWAPSFEVMLVIRIFQGVGMFINLTGIYVWSVELTPTHLRSVANGAIMNIWSVGYICITLCGYLIPTWNYIFLTVGIMNYILTIPLLIYPISPRFALVRGREEEAKRTLESFSRLCNNETSMADVNLTYKKRVLTFFEQLKDFKTYPTLRKETLLGLIAWFIVAVLFYGFSFGWVQISSDLYTGHLAAAISKMFGYSIAIPLCNWIGRKKTMLSILAVKQ